MKFLNCKYENKFIFMKSTEYEERFSNHSSIVIYGASIVLDVLKLNAIPGMFFQVITVGHWH